MTLTLIKDKKLEQHIYVVFSGGDDCFLIGTWEKILDLAIVIRKKFKEFQDNLREDIRFQLENDITFSAGIVVFSPKYPMLRLSEEVEEALSASKSVAQKDSVTCFGNTVSWGEFEQSQRIANQLIVLIGDKKEAKSLIERIKSSDIGLDKLQQDARKGRINIPKVWRLKYYLRNVRASNREEVGKIFEEYENAIMNAFLKKDDRGTNPVLYPLAARWAELFLKL